jgi:hypothetical protein
VIAITPAAPAAKIPIHQLLQKQLEKILSGGDKAPMKTAVGGGTEPSASAQELAHLKMILTSIMHNSEPFNLVMGVFIVLQSLSTASVDEACSPLGQAAMESTHILDFIEYALAKAGSNYL